MKTSLAVITFLAILSATSQAGVGETVKQVEARYGKPERVLHEHGSFRKLDYGYRGLMAHGYAADAALARRTTLGISRALFDRHRADPCVPWPIGCGARDADRPQRHPLRNGHHGLSLVSHVPVTGDGLDGTGCAG